MIARELDESVDSRYYWTDSTTVLKYIRNEKKRFQVSVANHVQTIRDATNPQQWKYVESRRNSADDASRGIDGQELSPQCRWITGPNFLWLPDSEWPQLPDDLDDIPVDNPEVKRISVHSTDVDENTSFLTRLTRFSEWHPLKRSIAWILRLKPKRNNTDNGTRRGGNATKFEVKSPRVEELDRAEKIILNLVQSEAFPKEKKPCRRFKEQIPRTIANSRRRRSLKLRSRVPCFASIPF